MWLFDLLLFSCQPVLHNPLGCSTQAFLSLTISWSLPKLISIESVMPSNHLICYHLLLLPSIFPSIRVFSNKWVTRGSKKDSNRAMIPAVEAVDVPAHLVPPESWQPRQVHHLHAQPSLGQSCHRPNKQTKSLASMRSGLLWSCSTICDPVDCGLSGFSVRGVRQARILECIGQHWLPYPSRALYFLLL